jgi:hypothetical protein
VTGSETVSDLIKVPLSYAPKRKVLIRFDNDPNIDRPSAVTLPRMSFEITGYNYDGVRNVSNLNRYVTKNHDDANKMKYIHTGAPYNINFNLYIYVKNSEDMNKIVEQILPFFKPEWTATLQLIPELGINMDIPVILNSNMVEDAYNGSFTDRQVLTYTFGFTMKAWYFGPEYNKPIIKFANANFYVPYGNTTVVDGIGNTDLLGSIKVYPGLDDDGNPTSNSSISIDTNEIFVDDDFGYIEEISGITISEN